MPDTVYSSDLIPHAVSNLVFAWTTESNDSEPVITDGCCFQVVDNASQLDLITSPNDEDVVFIINGTGGGYDMAVYQTDTWLIKPLKGDEGDMGSPGNDGAAGANGSDGATGATGAQGETGDKPDHEWSGTALRFELPVGGWGDFVDLKGDTGAAGADGTNGINGSAPLHEWDDTSLRFKLPDDNWGDYVDLKGDKGDKPAHEWAGTTIRFQNPDGNWGSYVDLKGDQGDQGIQGEQGIQGIQGDQGIQGEQGEQGIQGNDGDTPEHEWSGTSIRFELPGGGWGDFVDLQGAQGLQGSQGIQGVQGEPGIGAPQWFLGDTEPIPGDPAGAEDGDFYLNTNNHRIYQRAGGAWVKEYEGSFVTDSLYMYLKKPGNTDNLGVQTGDVRFGFLESTIVGFQQYDGASWNDVGTTFQVA